MIRLGSNSITRASILKAHEIEFIQDGGNFDEDSITTDNPKSFVYEATLGKYQECLALYGCDIPLLVADTVVTANNQLLRKAKDEKDARRMLELQSGNEVKIITCMIFKSNQLEFVDISSTVYTFKQFDDIKVNKYINSGQCFGKAGAIMVEGFAKEYIQEVRGYESCAMGLAIEKLLPYI
ncbi:MAG: septum formation inhibitor Maf [Campylobacterota bacterium]|nr:septum formation inhibitor Maf [Campylobacterota bacterium]